MQPVFCTDCAVGFITGNGYIVVIIAKGTAPFTRPEKNNIWYS